MSWYKTNVNAYCVVFYVNEEDDEADEPLGADKTHSSSKGVFSVFSNDKNKNYDTIRSVWEFSKNQDQPEVCSSICLEITLF